MSAWTAPLVRCLFVLTLAACTSSTTGSQGLASTTPQTTPSPSRPASTPSARPAIAASELKGKILFARAGGQYEDQTLFTANADGSGDTRVGGFLADKTTCCQRWSADGRRIAFVALTPDGRPTTGTTDPGGENLELFDPPGTFIGACTIPSLGTDRLACEASHSDDPGSGGIYTVRASDGSDPQAVITDVGLAIPMDFSPEGAQLVYIGDPVGPPTGVDADAPVGSLYVVNVDGTDLVRITPDGVYATSTASWSPDGQWILFGGLAQSGDPLWAVRPDGTEFHEVFKPDDDRGAGCATWSPDGEFVLFCLNAPDTLATLSEAPRNGLYVIRADGSDLTPVIVTPDWKRDPDWAE